jgi:signal peptidase I
MWRHIKRTLSVAMLLVILVLGVGAGFVQRNGGKLLSVQTGSMTPSIKTGALVAVSRVPESQLAVGDVITYISPKNSKKTITHRVVTLPSPTTKGMIVTKGDANPVADAPFSPKYVVGRVNLSVPYLGHAVDFVRQPIGLAILIYVPALAIMINEVRILSVHYRKMRPYFAAKLLDRLNTGRRKSRKMVTTAVATPLALVISLAVTIPVQATLKSNSVVLASNSFSVSALLPPGPHVTFRKVTLRCSADNTLLTNRRPVIIIYNGTHADVVTHGWKIVDDNGVVINIPDGYVLKKLRQYSYTPYLSNGLKYAGDHLSLLNDIGQKVDALSWGTDTTAFNPSIAPPASGTRLERRPFNQDTDNASDWRAFDHACNCPVQPDVQAGDDAGEFGDLSEPNRVMVPDTFNVREL